MIDPTSDTERIRRAYDGYEAAGRARSHWGADNTGNSLILAERDALLAQAVDGTCEDIQPVRVSGTIDILEVGCGSGSVLRGLGAEGRRLVGADLLAERLPSQAPTTLGPHFLCSDGAHLPFRDATFDIVVTFTIFSSIPTDSMAFAVAAEIDRVLRPTGRVIWYDIRRPSPMNRNVRAIGSRKIRELFPAHRIDLHTCTVLPPLARRLGRRADHRYEVISRIEILRTHYFAVLTKPSAH